MRISPDTLYTLWLWAVGLLAAVLFFAIMAPSIIMVGILMWSMIL